MPGKVKKLDKQLTQILDDMKAHMPVKNPAFDPDSKELLNRQFTWNLAIREHQMFGARLKEAIQDGKVAGEINMSKLF
jgi:hypothetical protein